MSRHHYYIGVDAGTGSARAGVFDGKGQMLDSDSHSIEVWEPVVDFVEQSSEDIWQSVSRAVRGAVKGSGVEPEQVKGIGFDATQLEKAAHFFDLSD